MIISVIIPCYNMERSVGDAVKWTDEPVECDIIFRIKKP